MDWKENSRKFIKMKNKNSFQIAWLGIITAFQREKHIKVQTISALLVLFLAALLKVSPLEWLFLLFSIGWVITTELINSAIEAVVDLTTEGEYHLLAGIAKDIAAGAVLISAIISAVVGAVIFIPYLLDFIN